jgi:prepilin-type processing-associated H-X9-DG protein
MKQNTSPSVSPQKPSVGHLPIMPDRLAKWAYRLACLGPFSLLVIALAYPPAYRALPALPVQILWWILALASPLGFALGAVALVLIHRSPTRIRGSSYGTAAMGVGFAASLALIYGTRSLNDMRKANHRRLYSCISNVKQLSLSMYMYAQDYDDHYPLSASWNAATLPYNRNSEIYHCPDEDVQNVPSYAMNRLLSGAKTGDISDPTRTVLLFDSVPGENRVGSRELLPTPDRHNGSQSIGFVDGHVKPIHVEEIDTLLWTLETGAQTKKKKAGHEAH